MKRYDIDSYDWRPEESKTGKYVEFIEVKPLLDHIVELKDENGILNRLFKLQHKRSLEALEWLMSQIKQEIK